eukprot:scaffold287102_cov32-Tisochrysis_lutea.AAC.2
MGLADAISAADVKVLCAPVGDEVLHLVELRTARQRAVVQDIASRVSDVAIRPDQLPVGCMQCVSYCAES